MTGQQLTLEEMQGPRLSEAQRLRMAEGEMVELRRIKARVDEVRREHPGASWAELYGRTLSPYATLEDLRARLRLAPGDRLDEFLALHRADPRSFTWLLEQSRKLKGKKLRYSIGFLAELQRMKMDAPGTPADGEPFVVNNTWRAYYARLLILFDPSLADRLVVRQSAGRVPL